MDFCCIFAGRTEDVDNLTCGIFEVILPFGNFTTALSPVLPPFSLLLGINISVERNLESVSR